LRGTRFTVKSGRNYEIFFMQDRKTLANREIQNNTRHPPIREPPERLLYPIDTSQTVPYPLKIQKALTSPFYMLREREIERQCCCQERSRNTTPVYRLSSTFNSSSFQRNHHHRPAAPVNQPKVRTVTPAIENRKAKVCFSAKLIAPLQVAHT
jgi:hypothetical protein